MRRLALPALSLALVAACQPGVAPLSDEDVVALRNLGTAHTEAVLAGDMDAAVAMYAEDAIWLAPDAPALEGRAAIRATMQLEPGITLQDFTITSLEIDGYGDLAYDRGTWSQTIVSEGVEEPITFTGTYVVIARKQEDGSWLWTVDIWNSDAPLPRPDDT
ncbi:MAG: DUF4440 domain-containing protein [Gemmatimonadota bacterium]|nr:MAG: DUF4440 domain-containing protein [Gemmatimonadota bacterium]